MTGLIHEPLLVEIPVETELVRDLREARQIIAKGWCQRRYTRGDSHCTLGAIMSVTRSAGRTTRMFAAVEQIIGHPPGGIIAWNDQPERTQTDVLAVLDQAIHNNT